VEFFASGGYDGSYDLSGALTVGGIATTLTADDKSGMVGVPVDLTATLKDSSNNLLSGKNIFFWLDINDDGDWNDVNEVLGMAVTNSAGIATKSVTVPAKNGDGVLPIYVEFFASGGYDGSYDMSRTLTINAIATILTADNKTGMVGVPVDLTTTLKDTSNNQQ